MAGEGLYCCTNEFFSGSDPNPKSRLNLPFCTIFLFQIFFHFNSKTIFIPALVAAAMVTIP